MQLPLLEEIRDLKMDIDTTRLQATVAAADKQAEMLTRFASFKPPQRKLPPTGPEK